MLKVEGGVNGPLESRNPVNDYLEVNLWSRGWRGLKSLFCCSIYWMGGLNHWIFSSRKNAFFINQKKVCMPCQASKLCRVKGFCPQQIQAIFLESNGPFLASISHFLRTFFYFYLMTLSPEWINLSVLPLLQLPLIYYTNIPFSGKVQIFSSYRHFKRSWRSQSACSFDVILLLLLLLLHFCKFP